MSALKIGDKVTAKVVLVKPDADYCVVQLDGHQGVLGYVPACDYNMQHSAAKKTFKQGDSVSATVVSCPDGATGGRLLLHTPLIQAKRASHKGSAVKPTKSSLGTVAKGIVASVHAGYADVTVEGVKGRLNAAEVQEMDADTSPVCFGLFSADEP